MRVAIWIPLAVLCAFVWQWGHAVGLAQDAQPAPPGPEVELPEIADEPKTIDPAALMPEQLTARATADLSKSSLSEVAAWLRDEQKIVVLLKRNALADAGVLPSEPVSDRLQDEPLYVLLNRLRSIRLGWYFENDVLYVTSADEVDERLTTVPYNIGDLLDAGHDADDLGDVIESTVAPDGWQSVGGAGALSFIGDVMFVRQTDAIQREVQGLLAALRKPGRQTFILDPPRHEAIRRKLEENVSVDFLDMPLESAIRELSAAAGVDLRLDLPALRAARVREREPVTVRLTDRKLKTVLQATIMDLELDWILRDGLLWVTSVQEAEEFLKTAVYDVRDLCRDAQESEALREAITSQTESQLWDEVGGPGSIAFARPGVMVVRNQERILTAVLELLETYRTALRASKPRDRGPAPDEVTTVYYRMHAGVALDLLVLLRTLVRPDSWQSDTQPGAPGRIVLASSAPDTTALAGGVKAIDDSDDGIRLVVSQAVLIITQTRQAHEEIAEVIRRVESGDPEPGLTDGPRGGMGGFGGGFYTVPPE